jgi:hypothetical protein
VVPMSERKGKARAKQERLEGEVAVNYDANLLKWCRRPGTTRSKLFGTVETQLLMFQRVT